MQIDSLGKHYQVKDGLYQVKFHKYNRGQKSYKITYDVPRPVKASPIPDPSSQGKPARLKLEIQGFGYFDEQNEVYTEIENCREVTPLTAGNQITYPNIFSDIDLRYTCLNTRMKEEVIISEAARSNLPDPSDYNIDPNNAYLMVEMAFKITPNLKALAKGQTEPYISRPILIRAREMGIAVVPGDDVHRITDVDCFWDQGIRILQEVGLSTNWRRPVE